MLSGRVKWFDEAKGYGFVVPDDGSGDVYFSRARVDADKACAFAPGAKVTFSVATDPRGRRQAETMSVAVPPARTEPPRPGRFKRKPEAVLSPWEEFEREWGLKPVS